MSDPEILVTALAVIYLSECVHWAGGGAVVFRSYFSWHAQLCYPSPYVGNRTVGAVPLNPIAPFGFSYFCCEPSIAYSIDGVTAFEYDEIGPIDGRHDLRGRFCDYARITGIAPESKNLLINGEHFAKTGSTWSASHHANVIESLCMSLISERGQIIVSELRSAFDADEIRKRLSVYRRITKWLRIWCALLFTEMLVVLPATVLSQHLSRTWHWQLGVTVLLIVAIQIEFARSYGALFPGERTKRRKTMVTMAISPPMAVRAYQNVAADLLWQFDPLAVSYVCCNETDFRAFARRRLLEAKYPLSPRDNETSQHSEACMAWYTSRYIEQTVAFVLERGIDLGELLGPPPIDGQDCRSYCPRCDRTYIRDDGNCGHCPGIQLVRFDLSSTTNS